MRCQRLFGVLLFVLAMAGSAHAATITFDSASVNVNDTFGVAVRVLDVTDLFTFGFDLTYNPGVLQFVGADEGDFLASAIVTPPSDPNNPNVTFFFPPDASTPGLLSLVLGSLSGPDQLSGATGSGILATLRFMAIGTGSAALALANVQLFDSAIPEGNLIEAGIESGVVTVGSTVVPEPASLTLFGLGLFALARRFR